MKSLAAIIKIVLAALVVLVLNLWMPKQALAEQAIEVSPDPVSFPNTEVGAASTKITVTVSREIAGEVKINSATVDDTASFNIQDDHCSGQKINYGESCTFDVHFQPQSQQGYQTTLRIKYSKNSVRKVTVTGTGYIPPLEPETTLIDFGGVPVNTTDTRTVTLTNIALVPITVASLSTPVGSSFSVSQDCVTTFPVGGACDMDVYFSPISVQTYSSALTVRDTYGNDFEIDLDGSGIEHEAGITVIPEQIDFGAQTIETSSNPSPVAIVSTGQGNLEIRNIESSSSAYTITDTGDCAHKTLVNGETCTFYITFTPAAVIDYHETVKIENNVSTKDPKNVTVLGVGKEPGKPAVDLSVNRYDFGSIYVGEQSSNYPVTFVNAGEADLVVTNITASSGFGVDIGSCIGTYAPSGNCTFQMYFAPTEAGDYNEGAITLADNAPDPGEVTVYGVGKNRNGPAIDISPRGSHDFGTQTVGTASSPYSFTLGSVGDLPLIISGIAPSGDFTSTGNCAKTLNPGSSCVIFSTFYPTASGTRTGDISITDNAPLSPQMIGLSGTGYTPADPTVILSPGTLDFGSQTIGTEGETLSVLLKNTGGSALTVASLEIAGEFSQQNDCVGTILAGGRCVIVVNFAPKTIGEFTGVITIVDNASGSPHSVNLRGSGTQAQTPAASLSATTLDFGKQDIATNATQTLTITNTGTSDLSIGLTVIEGEGKDAFSMSDNCRGNAVEPNTSCTIDVTFHPAAIYVYTASLSIADNAADSPQAVVLTGDGEYPEASGCALLRGGVH